ncbi:Zinc finger protein jing homolog [Gryllus bimaculatus]|nr:Zinc finger protein jing homolog [Gryllus bimaculatus]
MCARLLASTGGRDTTGLRNGGGWSLESAGLEHGQGFRLQIRKETTGVAVLSCTDCSASSSSGTSDITDPGSPYSTTSTHSSHSESGDDAAAPSPTPGPGPGPGPAPGGVGGEERAGAAAAAAEEPLAPGHGPSPAPNPAAVVVLQPFFMAPNVPSDQRDDALHCWAWGGAERGPPPPPPSPLTPVTASNVIANMNPKSLKRQTAIVNHKTAAANKASPATSPSSKRLKLDHSPSPKTGLSNNNNNNNNNNAKSSTSLCAALRHQPQRCCSALHNQPKAQCPKLGKGDGKGRSLGGAILQTDAAAHAKLQQQGKITEYFKTQMKPMNGAKKDLAAKTGSSEFRSPVSQMVCRKSASDVKTDRNSSGGLDKYFNINSGTQPATTIPLLKVPEVKDLVGSNLPLATSVQTLSWNSKCDVTDCNSRSTKTAQKVNEKINLAASTPAHKELPAPATTLKIPEVKKNGLVSPSLSSQKLTSLLLPPPSTQNDSSSPSTFSPNLPESTSCTSQLVTPEVSEVVCNVPKPDSMEETDVLLEKEVLASSTPAGKASSILEDSAVSTSGDQSESVASIASDSGLSVSVSSSSPAPSSLPSPILSVPRTIRFPAIDCSQSNVSKSATIDQSDSTTCRWSECNSHFESSTILLEHLQAKHVNTQGMCETFVCLWVGCKVYARTSCSRSWLERHVLSHGGNKPFRCIVDGCGQRFSSQTTLERHVNSHFNQTEGGSSSTSTRRSVENSTNKMFRRNGKRLRLRRQPWSARMFDYFDSGIMEGLQHRLMNMTEKRTLGDVASAPGNTISLHSKVMARRVEPSGKTKVLLRWYPEDIVDDEWVLETDVRRTQTVPIRQLTSSAVDPIHSVLFSSASSSNNSNSSSSVSINVTSDNSPGCSSSSCSSTTTTRRRPRKAGKPAS